MKSLICVSPGHFEYADKPEPTPTSGKTIIRIKRIGICGTDLHAFEGTQPYFQYPRILGHELSAEIVDTPPGGFNTGDIVTIMPYFYCGTCYACRIGSTNCCANLQVAGVHTDGGFAEYYSVPNYAIVASNGLTLDQLALTEPLAIGAHGIRRADIKEGETVLIIGTGPIGMALITFAKLAGAVVIVMDVNDFRLDFCKTHLGVEYILNAKNPSTNKQFEDITNGELAPVVIDATGNIAAINNAFRYMSHRGRYVLVGLQKESITFSHPDFHKKEGTLMSSRNATKADFEFVIDSVHSKRIDPLPLITNRVPFLKVKDEFASWLNPANNVIKALVEV